MSKVIAQGLQSYATTQTKAFEDPLVRATLAAQLILGMITLMLFLPLGLMLSYCEQTKKNEQQEEEEEEVQT